MVLLASDFDKSRYLKAADIERERKFRIKSVTAEEVGTGADKEKKLVVWFTNDECGLVLNKTNNRVLRSAFGDDVAGWAGKGLSINKTVNLAFGVVDFVDLAKWCSSSPRGKNGGQG